MVTEEKLKEPAKSNQSYLSGEVGRLYVFSQIKSGKTPIEVIHEGKLSERSIWRFLRELRANGYIKKVGYGTWEALKEPANLTIGYSKTFKKRQPQELAGCITKKLRNNIRGHAFVFHLKIPKISNWHNRKEYMDKKKISYLDKRWYQRIMVHHNKIWLCDRAIIIYFQEGKSYLSKTPTSSELLAKYDCFNLITTLENLFSISFKINKNYVFKVSRHHFSLIKDELAKLCEKNKERISVKLENGYFMIDNSYHLHEAETQGKEAIPYINHYKYFVEKICEDGLKPEDLVNQSTFSKVMSEFKDEALIPLKIQIIKHLEVLQGINNNLGKEAEVQEETLKTLKEIKSSLKQSITTKDDLPRFKDQFNSLSIDEQFRFTRELIKRGVI